VRAGAVNVVLVGYQDQGNLGLGYLASVLLEHGYHVTVVDFREGPHAVLRAVRAHRPLVIGFSLIFQYYLPRFASLAAFLRARGVTAHITVGGHYPTLRFKDTLQTIPELDSVVRFEGEFTLLELVSTLAAGGDWHRVRGIAYRHDRDVIETPLRPLVANLDELPFPYRPFEADKMLGKKILPVLATRGCPRHCAFCSIQEFYGQAPGKAVRRRSPANVAREIRELYETGNGQIFLFQDDDFPTYGAAGHRWVRSFTNELAHQQLLGKVIWKISCRVDEVDPEIFSEMQTAGLYLVYLGIESGTDTGLETLNKQVSVADNLRAIATLKRLGLGFGYGFMLFDPSSTFDSVRTNIDFLRKIVGDGSSAVVFCKMLPYAGTPIESELAAAGRLNDNIVQPDYRFIDPRLDIFYQRLNAVTGPWLDGPDALSGTLNVLAHEVAIIRRLFPKLEGFHEYQSCLRDVTRHCNNKILDAIETSLVSFENYGRFGLDEIAMAEWARDRAHTCIDRRNAFVFRNQNRMLDALAADAA
jgi:radical SAM superfamily enzyme YgiQ (UPF0313 family)